MIKPIAQIVCHHCKRAFVSLFRVRDEKGKKTEDYVCTKCVKEFPTPVLEDISRRYIPEDPGQKPPKEMVDEFALWERKNKAFEDWQYTNSQDYQEMAMARLVKDSFKRKRAKKVA